MEFAKAIKSKTNNSIDEWYTPISARPTFQSIYVCHDMLPERIMYTD